MLADEIDSAGRCGSAEDCAEVSYAMLIGLRSAVYFDDNLELADARRLFKTTMSSLAGISGVSASRGAVKSA